MTGGTPLILVIEDELSIRRFLRASLSGEGYRLAEADTGQQGLAMAALQPPDLVILDLGLPDMDGLQIIEELRRWSQMPMIILSARDQERDKVIALDRGADDYLSKPFGVDELLARIRVALRHQARLRGQPADAATRFSVGDLTVDLEARRILVRGQEAHLTPIEYRLLTTFVLHAGKVLPTGFCSRRCGDQVILKKRTTSESSQPISAVSWKSILPALATCSPSKAWGIAWRQSDNALQERSASYASMSARSIWGWATHEVILSDANGKGG